MKNYIELNNQRALNIETTDGGIIATYYTSKGEIEKKQFIESKDVVMLLNYYYFKKENKATIETENGERWAIDKGEMF